MIFDAVTVGIFGTIALLAMGLPLIVSVSTRNAGYVDTALLMALTTGLISSLAAFGYAITGQMFWSALNNAGYAFALGCIWVVAAMLSGRTIRIRWILTAVISLLVLAAPYFEQGENITWRGGHIYLIAVLTLSFACAFELFTGESAEILQARVCGWVFAVNGAYFAVRLVVFVVRGPDDPFFVDWLGSAMTTLFVIVVYISGGNLLLSLRADIVLRSMVHKLEIHPLATLLGRDEFVGASSDLLKELQSEGRRAVAVVMHIGNLGDLARVFGEWSADAVATQSIAQAIEVFPSSSIATRRTRGEFQFILQDVTVEEAEADATQIGVQLKSQRIDGLDFVTGFNVSFGLADSSTIGYDSDKLFRAAEVALKAQLRAEYPTLSPGDEPRPQA